MCHFKLRIEPETLTLIYERDVCQNDFLTPRWLSAVFVSRNDMIFVSWNDCDVMLRFQSRDKWSLNNYDAIEIKSKGFYASSVTLLYGQNSTSKLKLRRALFLISVSRLLSHEKKLILCQVAFHYKQDGYANPENMHRLDHESRTSECWWHKGTKKSRSFIFPLYNTLQCSENNENNDN